jgi:hypothetical protein
MSFRFQMPDVAYLLNAPASRLNKLLERFDLRRSLAGGGKQGIRLAFSLQDICRLGLALWLFEAGLRSPVIRLVLKDPFPKDYLGPLQSLDSVRTESRRQRSLVLTWTRRNDAHPGHKAQLRISITGFPAEALVAEPTARGQILIPVGLFLDEIAGRLERYII